MRYHQSSHPDTWPRRGPAEDFLSDRATGPTVSEDLCRKCCSFLGVPTIAVAASETLDVTYM